MSEGKKFGLEKIGTASKFLVMMIIVLHIIYFIQSTYHEATSTSWRIYVGACLENTEYGMDKNLFLEYCLPFKGYPFHVNTF